MASMQRLGTTHLSNPEGFYNSGGSHRSLNANLDKSHSFRDGHEGRPGAGIPSGAGSSSNGELLPLSSVLSLDALVVDNKSSRQVELRRAINAATGVQSEDPSLGNIQVKPLSSYSAEELKRVRVGLSDLGCKARERAQHLTEAITKLDRFRTSQQSRKRSRPESTLHDRLPAQGAAQRPAGSTHLTKAIFSAAASTLETTSSQKGGDKAKSGTFSKRVRTSLANEVRQPDGRSSNLSVQRASCVQDRERDSSKSSSSLASPVEEKERTPLATSEGWERTKMKGRRSATIKAEAHVVTVANGSIDGEREHKGNGQHHRASGDSRSRPSEGHGYRSGSGPVNGITSVQKAESSVQANGSTNRGNKVESDGALHTGEKADRPTFPERDRSTSKGGVKSSPREETHIASPPVTSKAKGARAPRSNLVAGSNPIHQFSRSPSFTDVREKSTVTAVPKPQVPSGAPNRKRPAPSRSSSPPVASWGSSRPQKQMRVARRVPPKAPLSISTPPKEETNGPAEVGTPGQVGSSMASTPGARSTPPAITAGSNLATRVTATSTHSLSQSRSRNERSNVSMGPMESEDSGEDSHKLKEKLKKHEGDLVDQKVFSSSQKMASVVTAKKARLVEKEELGGGDGVRRQGRTGRGSVALRVPAVTSPTEKVEVSPVNAKLTRSARATMETKPVGPGRPVTKIKGTVDRRAATRPRRLLGNGLGELSGEDDDDHEQLVTAVRQAIESSVAACPNNFWKQVEPYFAYVTPDDLSFLQRQMGLLRNNSAPSPSLKLDTVSRSLSLVNGVIENDGAFSSKDYKTLKDENENGQSLRRGMGRGWLDKIFPLSQRLLSAFINEGQEDDRLGESDEAFLDKDSDSTETLRSKVDYDGRDPEGESDNDNVKLESDQWRSIKREGPFSDCSPMINGHGGRLWVDGQEEDIIFVDTEEEQAGRQNWASDQMYSQEDQHGLSDWKAQWQRMSLDDRLQLELQSIGLLPEQPPEQFELEDDEICEELRKLKQQLDEQVSINKKNISCLENAILAKKEADARARERSAVDKLVEIAFKKRIGGRAAKGAAAKGARSAALAFAKRVLARVQSFDAGHRCIVDHALRDSLFCLPAKVIETARGGTGNIDTGAAATTRVADCTTPNLGSPSKLTVGGTLVGVSAGWQIEGKDMSERDLLDEMRPSSTDYMHSRDETWPLRTKERELLLEDVAGPTLTRGVNILSISGLGGVKGKRSERDREGKAAHFKDAHARIGDVAKEVNFTGRSGLGSTKGERKTKPKPRQKTGPLLKAVKGLVPKPSDQQVFKDRSTNQTHAALATLSGQTDDPIGVDPMFISHEPQDDSEGHIDLSALPLPGMEDMSVNDMGPQQDLGSWLDFDEEEQPTDEFLMGLDVPMDDLSDLGMMM